MRKAFHYEVASHLPVFPTAILQQSETLLRPHSQTDSLS